jgi:hypothetical protein
MIAVFVASFLSTLLTYLFCIHQHRKATRVYQENFSLIVDKYDEVVMKYNDAADRQLALSKRYSEVVRANEDLILKANRFEHRFNTAQETIARLEAQLSPRQERSALQ